MTRAEFLTTLRTMTNAEGVEWKRDGRLLRCFKTGDIAGNCPLSFVAGFDVPLYNAAYVKKLDMTTKEVSQILAESDWEPSPELLAACGLSPEVTG